MPIFIPVTFFGTLILAFVGIGRQGLRQSLVYATIVYTTCLVCATEVLSIWSLLRFETVLAFWTGGTILSTYLLWSYGDRSATRQTLQRAWAACRTSRFELGGIVVILATILLIAVVAPPNNWESMEYRMMRVVMWIQQGSVAHYPTSELDQLQRMPLPSWNILHFQILSGGDRFANTVDWFALAGCGILVSLIARELKQPFPVQALATVIAVTLPMGVLQGSSTQDNLTATFWLLASTVLTLQYFKKPLGVHLVCCGLALGFALLSKGTMYAIAPPVTTTLWLYGIVRTKGRRRRAKLIGTGVGVVLVALLVNGGHFTRNWDLFGHPLMGPERYDSHINEQISVLGLLSNFIRNAALHWGLPSEEINDFTLDTLQRVFGDWLDRIPGTTLGPPFFETGIPFSLGEYRAGNFLHFWLLAASLLGILLFRRWLQFNAWTVCFVLAVVLGTIAFCSLLQWELWNSRYHTPLFMLGVPLIATFVAGLLSRGPVRITSRPSSVRSSHSDLDLIKKIGRRRSMVAGTFLMTSIPWVVSNDFRPLYPATAIWQSMSSSSLSIFSSNRTRMYFNPSSGIFWSYTDAVDFLAAQNPQEIGLYLGDGSNAYTIWALLQERLSIISRVRYVGKTNASGKLRNGSYAPPLLFSTLGKVSTLAGKAYRVVFESPPVTVLTMEAGGVDAIPEGWARTLSESEQFVIRPDLDVYFHRNDNKLVYVKNQCRHTQADQVSAWPTIFLHILPADVDTLPDDKKPHGLDNLEFRFRALNAIPFGRGRCAVVRQLPTYDVVSIRTGEYTDEDLLWEASLDFDPPLIFSTREPLLTLEEHYSIVSQSPVRYDSGNDKIRQGTMERWKGILNPRNLLTRSNLEVYFDRNKNRLVYVKNECRSAPTVSTQSNQLPVEPPIFLHVIPADMDDLPDHRKPNQFDNFDFHFHDYRINIRLGERCWAARKLPAYVIAGIRTGQYTDEGYIWESYVRFNE